MDVLLLLELFIFRYYLWGVHFIMIVCLLHFQGFVSRIYRPAFVGKCGPGIENFRSSTFVCSSAWLSDRQMN